MSTRVKGPCRGIMAAALTVLAAWAPPSRAAESDGLSVDVKDPAGICPPLSSAVKEVEAALARAPAGRRPTRIAIRVQARRGRASGVVEVTGVSGEITRRSIDDISCNPVAEALVIVALQAIDEAVGREPATEEVASEPPPPSEVPEPAKPQRTEPRPRKKPHARAVANIRRSHPMLEVRTSVGATGIAGLLPDAALRPALGGEIVWFAGPRPRLVLSAGPFAFSRGQAIRFLAAEATLSACPVTIIASPRLALVPCGTAALARIDGATYELARTGSATAWSPSAGATLRAEASLLSPLRAFVEAGALVNIGKIEWRLSGGELLHAIPWWQARFSVGLIFDLGLRP